MIKLFESFKKIEDLCQRYEIKNYTINSDGSIDVDGDVILYYEVLSKLPLIFNHVTGSFDCGTNHLISLEGAPRIVESNFWCRDNKLTSIEGAPQEIGGSFNCGYNRLTSLEGAPKEISAFYCDHNQLTSLEGAPRIIRNNLNCEINDIWTFEGAPDYIGGDFYCSGNPIWFIWVLFQDYSKMELFNYYDIIREVDGKPAIVLDRLNDFLEEIGRATVKKVDEYLNI